MRGIIAEIGNHHMGDMTKAKALILAAKECGADFVKMQAIDTKEFKGGSMTPDFYKKCDLGMDGYVDCVTYAEQVGIPLFFSIFGSCYLPLLTKYPDMPYKISGAQFKSFAVSYLQYWNDKVEHPLIVSVPKMDIAEIRAKKAAVSNMNVLYVSGYLEQNVDFTVISHLIQVFARPVGYSDHSVGLDNCRKAIMTYGCHLVEKHFNIFGQQSFGGQVYRDSIHASSATDMKALTKAYKERFHAVSDLPRL